MPIILDKLLSPPNYYQPNMPTYRFDIFQTRSFFGAMLAMIILRLADFSSLVILIGGLAVYYFIRQYEEREFLSKLEFLNGILYNGETEPFDIKSYLNLSPALVDFFYRTHYYIDDNLSAYRQALNGTNYFLRIGYDLEKNLMREPEYFYKNALMLSKDILNNYQSIIHKLVSSSLNYDYFNANLKELEKLLKEEMEGMKSRIKCGYNLYDLNIWTLPEPDNLNDRDDTKDKGYSPYWSFF